MGEKGKLIGEFENCRVFINAEAGTVTSLPNWAKLHRYEKDIAEIKKDFDKVGPQVVDLANKWMRAMVYGLEHVRMLKLYSRRTWDQAGVLLHLSATTGQAWPYAEEIDKAYEEGFANGKMGVELSSMGIRLLRDDKPKST